MFTSKILALAAVIALSATIGTPSLAMEPAQQLAPDQTEITTQFDEAGNQVFSTEATELTILPAEESTFTQAEYALLAPSIRCDLGVHHPHGSHHVTGTINGTASISCSGGNAGSLTIHYSLIRTAPNPTQWGGPTESNSGRNYISTNRGVSCKEGPGDFRGWGKSEIKPPPGYVLDTAPTYQKYGSILPIARGAASLSTQSESDLASLMTVTFVREDQKN